MKSLFPAVLSLAVLAPAAQAQETGSDTARFDRVGVRRDSIVPDARDRAAAATLSELLAARVPGLQVHPGSGAVGAGSRLRLRGASGIVSLGDPLVVVNGIRVIRDPNSIATNASEPYPSRVDDFVPDDVERVEVFTGPDAIARYGSEAANGVIEVWTRHGARGGPRVHAFAETGVATDQTNLPTAYARVGRYRDGERTPFCTLSFEVAGICASPGDSVLTQRVAKDAIFRTGGRRRVGASVDGGFGPLTYQAGANGERDLGVMKRDSRERADVHGAFTLRPVRGVELSGTALHIRNDLELPAGGRGMSNPLIVQMLEEPFFGGTDPRVDTLGTSQSARRTLARGAARLSPFGWLSIGGSYGIDDFSADETAELGRPSTTDPRPPIPLHGRASGVRRNADVFAQADYGYGRTLRFATMLGAERYSIRSFAKNLLGVDDQFSGSTLATSLHREALFGRQRVTWRDRVSASVAARRETVPGADEELRSGSLSAEWNLGREGFFPRAGWLDSFRLRAAYGRAETFPLDVEWGDFIVCQGPVCATDLADVRPQDQSELEAGFDAGLLGDRAGVSLTVYDRATDDALGYRMIVNNRYVVNAGRVTNRGAEARVRISAPANAPLFWELSGIGALNRNRFADDNDYLWIDGTQITRDGRPVGSYFGTTLKGYNDANGDGRITGLGCTSADRSRCEVEIGTESEYLGSPDPSRMLALQGRLRVRGVELAALLDHQGGNHKRNATEELRCAPGWNLCRGAYDASAPLDVQARDVALSYQGRVGLVEDASFTRLREASLSLSIPGRWARTFGGRGAQLTLAGRNLLTWTPYTGLDPETSSGAQTAVRFEDFFTQGLPRSLTTRIDVSF